MNDMSKYIGTLVVEVLLKDPFIVVEISREEEQGFFNIKCKKKSLKANHFVYTDVTESDYRLHNINDSVSIEEMALKIVDKVLKDIDKKLKEFDNRIPNNQSSIGLMRKDYKY